jgi:hypothetical protein
MKEIGSLTQLAASKSTQISLTFHTPALSSDLGPARASILSEKEILEN